MKRIVSLLVLLAVIVLGGYFSTGLVTERTLKKNLSTLNQANLISVDLIQYHRGLLKSKADLVWRMQTPEKIVHQDDGRSLVVPPKNYTFDMPLTIYHGPVIFKRGQVRFGLGMAHGELLLPEAYANEFSETFTSNSTQPKLMIDAFVTYLNKTRLHVNLSAFQLFSKTDQSQIEWLGMKSALVFSPEHARLQGDVTLDGMRLIGEELHLILDKVTSAYDIHKTAQGLFLGEVSFQLPMFQFTDKNNTELKLKQLDINSSSDVDEDRFTSSLHVAFETLLMHEKTYGPAEIDMSAKNLDAEVLANLNSRANQLQRSGVNRSEAQQALLSLLPDVPKLLSKGAVFEISKLRVGLPEGLLNGSVRLAFPKTKTDTPLQLLPNVEGEGQLNIPASFVKSLLARSYKQKLLTASAHVHAESTVTEEPAETQVATVDLDQQATHQADQKLADLIQAGALQAKGTDYVLELKLSAGRLLVNGHPFHSGMLNF